MSDVPEGKLSQHDWEIENEDDLRDVYCDMHGITARMIDPDDREVFLKQEYNRYFDTPEFNHTTVGCSGHEEER